MSVGTRLTPYDSAKTQEFYKKLFDWKIEAMGSGGDDRAGSRRHYRAYHRARARAGRKFADQFVSFARACRDFEGLLVMTRDAKEKAYKAYAFGNDFPGALVEARQFEDEALVYRSEFPVEGATLKLRNVTRLVPPGKIESEEYMTMSAPEKLLVRVEAKKK